MRISKRPDRKPAAYPGALVVVANPGTLPFVTQLALFRYADLLLGVHGSGMTNALYMRAGSYVVEVFGASFAEKGSWGLTKFDFLADVGLRRLQARAKNRPLHTALRV